MTVCVCVYRYINATALYYIPKLVPLLRFGKTHSVLRVFLCIGTLGREYWFQVSSSALCEDKMNTLLYTRTSVKTNKPLELVDIINFVSFLLQVGFMLFY